MGGVKSTLNWWLRSEGVPGGNGGGNAYDGALWEGVFPDNGDTADVPRIDHAAEAPAQSPPRIPEAEHNSEEHLDEGHPRTGPFDEAATQRPPTREMPGTGSPAKSSKKRKRDLNWTEAESSKLVELVTQRPNRNIREADWEAIAKQIQGRTSTWNQCQQRWDTLQRPYKKIKDHCDTHHKGVGQVTKAELRSLGLDTYMARNGELINKIFKYKSPMLGEGSSAPSTSTLGERGLASAAADVLLPTSTATASAVDVTELNLVATPGGLGPEAFAGGIQLHLAPDYHTEAMTSQALGPVPQIDYPFSEWQQFSFDDPFLTDPTTSSYEAPSFGLYLSDPPNLP